MTAIQNNLDIPLKLKEAVKLNMSFTQYLNIKFPLDTKRVFYIVKEFLKDSGLTLKHYEVCDRRKRYMFVLIKNNTKLSFVYNYKIKQFKCNILFSGVPVGERKFESDKDLTEYIFESLFK